MLKSQVLNVCALVLVQRFLDKQNRQFQKDESEIHLLGSYEQKFCLVLPYVDTDRLYMPWPPDGRWNLEEYETGDEIFVHPLSGQINPAWPLLIHHPMGLFLLPVPHHFHYSEALLVRKLIHRISFDSNSCIKLFAVTDHEQL